jgi:hypothetical protein
MTENQGLVLPCGASALFQQVLAEAVAGLGDATFVACVTWAYINFLIEFDLFWSFLLLSRLSRQYIKCGDQMGHEAWVLHLSWMARDKKSNILIYGRGYFRCALSSWAPKYMPWGSPVAPSCWLNRLHKLRRRLPEIERYWFKILILAIASPWSPRPRTPSIQSLTSFTSKVRQELCPPPR